MPRICSLFLVFAVSLVGLSAALVSAEGAAGPLRVSENGRYFVDGEGKPFYFLADTQWELFRRYSLDDAKLILENRKAKGFTVVMVMLTGVGSGTGPNLEGQRPWLNDNPAAPNPDYFTNVDAVVKLGVFVLPGQDLKVLRAVREKHFGAHRPTSTTVCVPQLASPAFLVEVEAIAVKRAE